MVSTRRAQALTCADTPSKASTSQSPPLSAERVEVVSPSSSAKKKPERAPKDAPAPEVAPVIGVPVQIIAIPVEVAVAKPAPEKSLKSKAQTAQAIAPKITPKIAPKITPKVANVDRRKPGRPKKGTTLPSKLKRIYKKRYIPKVKKGAEDDQRVGDLTAEPNICKRCGLDDTTMIHFYQKHNGLLTEGENTLSIPEKRRFWSRAVKKGHKLRCLRPECGLPMASSTAMVYHAKTCGVTIEKRPCPYCQKEYSEFTLQQHINEHDRSNGEWKRKGKYLDGLSVVKEPESGGVSGSVSQLPGLFGAAPHDVEEKSGTGSPKKGKAPKIRESERYQQRHKRLSAIRAVQRFQASDGEDEDSQESFENEDGASDEDNEDDTQSEESDDETEASKAKGGKKSLGRVKSTKFTSSVNFPRLCSYWKRSLEALGYAKCEVHGCDVVTATLPEIIKHHMTCLKLGHKLLPGVAKHSDDLMKCHNCKYRSHQLRRMIRHYKNVHKMSVKEAEEKANEKKLLRSSWQLTQKEYDDLKLFD
ncbi:hypothetical protein RvY_19321 [Ramazzottius varieornatus]|uniref:C2H2-type domain-containing protein n=1 Tax=Ramazzottius varieornatus TaxID=947166 RepID=A0A1D1WAX4_RAMVA|nr:hypothetical protein RvY_19321 [Ramazzottius varieornatus]